MYTMYMQPDYQRLIYMLVNISFYKQLVYNTH